MMGHDESASPPTSRNSGTSEAWHGYGCFFGGSPCFRGFSGKSTGKSVRHFGKVSLKKRRATLLGVCEGKGGVEAVLAGSRD